MFKMMVFRYAMVFLILIAPAVAGAQGMGMDDRPSRGDMAEERGGRRMSPPDDMRMRGRDDSERPSGMAERGGPPSEERMEKVRKRIEMLKMWRLTEELNLNEATAAKLFPILSKYDARRMELQRERFRLMKQIKTMQENRGANHDSAEVILRKVEQNKAAMDALVQAQNAELKKVLTPEQMLKYMAFEEKFMREMRQMLGKSRKNKGPGSGNRKLGARMPRGGGPEGTGNADDGNYPKADEVNNE